MWAKPVTLEAQYSYELALYLGWHCFAVYNRDHECKKHFQVSLRVQECILLDVCIAL